MAVDGNSVTSYEEESLCMNWGYLSYYVIDMCIPMVRVYACVCVDVDVYVYIHARIRVCVRACVRAVSACARAHVYRQFTVMS